MTSDPAPHIDALKRAGAAAVTFNAPLGEQRAAQIAADLRRRGVRRVVDLCCGRGALLHRIAEQDAAFDALGIDSDAQSIEYATERARAAGLSDRLRFEVGDAAEYTQPADVVLCIGGSHAFGGSREMLETLARIDGLTLVAIGDGVFTEAPSDSVASTFGDLPLGLAAYARLAEDTGWTVELSDLSTLDEWDAFESGWTAGVLATGSHEATRFAEERATAYGTYRGVLGFAWFLLSRDA